MARIAGVDLPREKAVLYALPLLYGIGKHNVHELVEKAGIDAFVRKSRGRDVLGACGQLGEPPVSPDLIALTPIESRC